MEKALKAKGYRNIELLGSGVSGRAYLADDHVHKIINNQVHYEREMRLMKHVGSHSGFPEYIDSYSIDVGHVIVMSYVQGVNISTLLSAFGSANKLFIYKITVNILDALNHLHKLEMVHLDISTNNIMIVEDPSDSAMPLKAILIDLGAGCRIPDTVDEPAFCNVLVNKSFHMGGVIQWPYSNLLNLKMPQDRDKIIKALRCKDIWQVGHVIWNISYGVDFYVLMPDSVRYGNLVSKILYNKRSIPGKGGHPTPPDFSKLDADGEEYRELWDEEYVNEVLNPSPEEMLTDTRLRDEAHIANIYHSFNISDERDMLHDFKMDEESEVHDLVRLLLPTSFNTCLSVEQILEYIKQTWTYNNRIFGPSSSKGKPLKNCNLPCEDPVNNYYIDRCKSCSHCEWDATGTPNQENSALVTHCRSRNVRPDDLIKRTKCNSKGQLWNPYRHECDLDLSDITTKELKNRYSILYVDRDTVNASTVKRRITQGNTEQLDTYENVSQILSRTSNHYLKGLDKELYFDMFNIGRPGIELGDIKGYEEMAETRQKQERKSYKKPLPKIKIVKR